MPSSATVGDISPGLTATKNFSFSAARAEANTKGLHILDQLEVKHPYILNNQRRQLAYNNHIQFALPRFVVPKYRPSP